ncbi:MAG TPA: hypothetical protein VK919_11835 [Solirubrobacterales bacterium]|nr:hypothetical protein [Solirubrobacterales bacterium]
MRKLIAGLTVAFVLVFASAASGHPSENRAEQAFFGGPHCHINQHSGNFAFPSHRAHIATGLPNTVFAAAACP